jgi:hypothetical protein
MRIVVVAVLAVARLSARPSAAFRLEEATIQQIQAAFRDGALTCRSLVDPYLRRIAGHDKNGAALNAIVMINPDALETADDLDRRFRQSGSVGPMHGVPVIVKDNWKYNIRSCEKDSHRQSRRDRRARHPSLPGVERVAGRRLFRVRSHGVARPLRGRGVPDRAERAA